MAIDAPTVIATTASALAIGGALAAGMRKWLNMNNRQMIHEYFSELKPNHGSSLNDIIRLEILPIIRELRENQKHIEKTIDKVESKVDKLEGRFEQHVDEWE